MKHLETEMAFFDEKSNSIWRVRYQYNDEGLLYVKIFCNLELFHHFDEIPHTNTKHPTKTQALELIRKAKKIEKNE